jgi:hypothetical protein
MSSVALEVVGWVGSAILVTSLLQSRLLRLRQLNLVASLLLTAYNLVLGVWPMVAMNIAIVAINVWHLTRLRTRHDPAHYAVVEVVPDDGYLAHVLEHRRADITRFNPDFAWDGTRPGALAFLVLRDDETVGVVLAHDAGDGVAEIALDYVSPRFRDFTPGEFVYRRSGLFTDRGFRSVVAPRSMRQADAYLADVGFQRRGEDRILDLVAPG